jgi:hypothetical protein
MLKHEASEFNNERRDGEKESNSSKKGNPALPEELLK